MIYLMEMPFDEQDELPDFGSICMVYSGKKILGTQPKHPEAVVRYRIFTLLAKDTDKLALITCAANGSKAIVADTGDTYMLCAGEWRKYTPSSGGGSGDDSSEWSDIDDEPSNEDNGSMTWGGI